MIKEEEEASWRLVDDQRHGSVELVKFLKAKLESWPPDRGAGERSCLCLRVVEKMCHL